MSKLIQGLIALFISGVIAGTILGYSLPRPNHFVKYATPMFDAKMFKPGEEFKTYIPDMDVLVRFEPDEKINRDEGTKWQTYAYTVVSERSKLGICEIHMPSGGSIHGVVNDKSSLGEWFNEKYFTWAFAHEMLHCIRGDFHE